MIQRKSGLLAYLSGLIPGVGYLYLGLKRRGIQAFVIWILIEPVLRLLGLEFLEVVKWLFWFYTFFDTINLASRMDKGEFIPDSDFVIVDRFKSKTDLNNSSDFFYLNRGLWPLIGWALIILGSISILNKLFKHSIIYNMIKSNISIYFIPVLLIFGGIYLLAKNKNFRE